MNLIEKYLFKARRDALRIRFWRIVLRYKTSYPHISGDAFAKLCDYAAYGKDGSKQLNLRKLRRAKTLFVPSHKLGELLDKHFEEISAIVLICGNSDQNFVEDLVLPKSIKLWLCQNYSVENGFGSILPIGLENLRLGKSGFKRYQMPYFGEKNENRILVPPMLITNSIRAEVLIMCKSLPQVYEVHENYLDTSVYFELIQQFKFVLVLEGNGFDTHRLWEVLLKGNFPVLLDSAWSRSLEKIGLPVCILPQISASNLEFVKIESIRHQIKPHTLQMLSMNYWKRLVDSYL